jgi:hypothetical protein
MTNFLLIEANELTGQGISRQKLGFKRSQEQKNTRP